MENSTLITQFLLKVVADLKTDAASKGQKIPVSSFRTEADNSRGLLFGADYFKYLVYGRGPGRQPPPDAMTQFVEANPDMLERAKQTYKYITSKQLGFLIGRKIAREGTEIFKGTKQGVDFNGVVDKNMEDLLKKIAMNEVVKIQTSLRVAIGSK